MGPQPGGNACDFFAKAASLRRLENTSFESSCRQDPIRGMTGRSRLVTSFRQEINVRYTGPRSVRPAADAPSPGSLQRPALALCLWQLKRPKQTRVCDKFPFNGPDLL